MCHNMRHFRVLGLDNSLNIHIIYYVRFSSEQDRLVVLVFQAFRKSSICLIFLTYYGN